MSQVSDFAQFVALVATKLGSAVNRLPQVTVSCPLNEFALERAEYRLSRSDSTSSGIIYSEKINSQTGEKALIEVGTDMVRLSLKIGYEGPDASLLTKEIEAKFFTRLGRSGLLCIRKKPIGNFDITLLFTSHDDGGIVERQLRSFLPVCRALSKQLRLSQVVENRRAGRIVFSKLIQVMPKPKTISPMDLLSEEPDSVSDDSIGSLITELGDLGKVEDIKNEEMDKTEDIFLI
jgi:hypothetical protein